MKTYLECIPCFTGQTLEVARMTTEDPDLRLRIMRRALTIMAEAPAGAPPPTVAADIYRMVRRLTGDPDPYRRIKERANEFALELLPRLRDIAARSDRPFEAALRLAIAGNLMDWGVRPHSAASESSVEQALHQALDAPIRGASRDVLRSQIESAEQILYLTDNAGEIAFDRLLVSHLPRPRLTVAVKGGPAIDDATMDDARQVGLADAVEVVSTGSDAPGTDLDDCSDAFRELFHRADVVIAKGQANYETLSDSRENIFYLLKVKCPVVARDTGRRAGDLLLLHRPPRNV